MSLRIPIVVVVALFVAVSCDQNLPTAAPDEAEVTAPGFKVVQNTKDVWTWWQENACTGEMMYAEFRMHVVVHETVDASGGVHTLFHLNPMNMKAVGQETGMVCTGGGPYKEQMRFRADGEFALYKVSNRYHFVCPGPGNDVVAYTDWAFHTNAHNELTAYVERSRTECMPD